MNHPLTLNMQDAHIQYIKLKQQLVHHLFQLSLYASTHLTTPRCLPVPCRWYVKWCQSGLWRPRPCIKLTRESVEKTNSFMWTHQPSCNWNTNMIVCECWQPAKMKCPVIAWLTSQRTMICLSFLKRKQTEIWWPSKSWQKEYSLNILIQGTTF